MVSIIIGILIVLVALVTGILLVVQSVNGGGF